MPQTELVPALANEEYLCLYRPHHRSLYWSLLLLPSMVVSYFLELFIAGK
jgi:hypothetical protein